jgi:hypothetical protein
MVGTREPQIAEVTDVHKSSAAREERRSATAVMPRAVATWPTYLFEFGRNASCLVNVQLLVRVAAATIRPPQSAGVG